MQSRDGNRGKTKRKTQDNVFQIANCINVFFSQIRLYINIESLMADKLKCV